MKTKLTKKQKAWKLLRILRLGTNKDLTAKHPKVVEAAKIVGPDRAIKYLSSNNKTTDLMVKGKRLPGSFQSRA